MELSLQHIIEVGGLLGIYAIIFAESGLFFGFFLPGDSLLFTAGFIASQGFFSIWALVIGTWIAAIVGDTVGYHFGKYVGPKLFTKEKSLFFDKKHPERAKVFYEKYGPKAIILARFIPIVRTFVPIVAGIGLMNYKTFITYNIIGGTLWTWTLPFAGYFLGNMIPDVDRYLLPIILVIIVVSFIPVIKEYLAYRKTSV